jgi:hypothetical protein
LLALLKESGGYFEIGDKKYQYMQSHLDLQAQKVSITA